MTTGSCVIYIHDKKLAVTTTDYKQLPTVYIFATASNLLYMFFPNPEILALHSVSKGKISYYHHRLLLLLNPEVILLSNTEWKDELRWVLQ